jgi:hypothetical protein
MHGDVMMANLELPSVDEVVRSLPRPLSIIQGQRQELSIDDVKLFDFARSHSSAFHRRRRLVLPRQIIHNPSFPPRQFNGSMQTLFPLPLPFRLLPPCCSDMGPHDHRYAVKVGRSLLCIGPFGPQRFSSSTRQQNMPANTCLHPSDTFLKFGWLFKDATAAYDCLF